MKKISNLRSKPLHIISADLCWDGRYPSRWQGSCFFPTGKTFRQIYGTCLIDYELEIGKIFLKNYEVWANVDWVSQTGRTQEFHTRTKFKNLNTSLGGKYIFRLREHINLYLGLGINGAFVHVHNYSRYVKRSVHKNGVGGVAKLGCYFEPVNHLFIELFTDYLYQKIRFEDSVQIGGFKTGAGLGFCFENFCVVLTRAMFEK